MAKIISFSYTPFPILDEHTGQIIGELFRPMIPVRLSYAHGVITPEFEALIDSGSDRNLFPLEFGELLGINFKKIKPKIVIGIGGVEIKAYQSKVNIWLNKERYSTDADFSGKQQHPLLGRQGFFDLFKSITLKESEKFTVIEL